MAGARSFNIPTPEDRTVQVSARGGTVTAKLNWSVNLGGKKSEGLKKAQMFVDSECLRCMDPLTPRRTGEMIRSATRGTVIGSGLIQYLSPYARRQYYEHKEKSKWFETMKKMHLEDIRKGALQLVNDS